MKKKINQILGEINLALSKINELEVEQMINQICLSEKIVVCGAGRVGMAIRGFGMRLAHLGLNAYSLGDSNVPSISTKDLLIVASGSGETQTIVDLVQIAQSNGSSIIAITGNVDSRIAKMATVIVKIEAPSKTKEVIGFKSAQPMTTLNEQSLGIFFDAVTLELMDKMNETHDTMWARHSNLE